MSSVATTTAIPWRDIQYTELLSKNGDFIEAISTDMNNFKADLITTDEFKSLLWTKKAIPMIVLAGISLIASLCFLAICGISSITIALIAGLPFLAILLLLLPVILARFVSISH